MLCFFLAETLMLYDSGTSETDRSVRPDKGITEISNDFFVVRFEGDYGFDRFLQQGGAETDHDILAFLTGNLIACGDELAFEKALFGCSTLSVISPDGGYLFGRNFDWVRSKILVVDSVPVNGYRSLSTVNLDFVLREGRGALSRLSDRELTVAALYAPLDGMNQAGLCVAVNMIEDRDGISQDRGKPDITTTTAIRLMLDKAASVGEALELLDSHDLHGSYGYMVHFALADRTGRSVAVEYVGNEMKIIPTPVLTNFYLDQGPKMGTGSRQSHERYEILSGLLEGSAAMNRNDVRSALSRVSKNNFEQFLTTEWSIIFDQENLNAWYYHREDFSRGYQFSIK